MRNIYITVFLVLAAGVTLFVTSFFYFDRHNHQVLYYDISVENKTTGFVRIDRYATEEKLIFKSVTSEHLAPLYTDTNVRMDLDRKYNLEDYEKRSGAGGMEEFTGVINKKGFASFLSSYASGFNYLENARIRKGAFIFEEDSPVTYLPILENYDFKRGKSQGFSSLVYFPGRHLPPISRFVTLTSIKDEYVKIGKRKIHTENLLLKIRGFPSGNVWVAKSDRSLIKIEIPSAGVKFTRTYQPSAPVTARPWAPSGDYAVSDVVIRSPGGGLRATITSPGKGDNLPAILLVQGGGAHDRDYQGFFSSIADYLSSNGYCVLRFDKRLSPSSGDASSATKDDELEDLRAAFDLLISQGNISKDRVAVVSHGEGAYNAIRLAAAVKPAVRAMVLMAPFVNFNTGDDEAFLRERAAKERWGDDYLADAVRALRQSADIAVNAPKDWIELIGRKCYARDMRSGPAIVSGESLSGLNIPVLILQGKEDGDVPASCAAELVRRLPDAAGATHSISYFSGMGHFFSEPVNDGITRAHYAVPKEVLANMKEWLDLYTANPVPAAQPDNGRREIVVDDEKSV